MSLLVSNFLKVRILTLLWGFSISWLFTRELTTALPMFAVIFIGNTVIMKILVK